MAGIYCALVHHPVLDREGREVTTSVTNLDVHDIARSARTYGLSGYFVVMPIEAQHPVVQRIVDHWSTGAGVKRFPERTEAISLVRLKNTLDDAIDAIVEEEGRRPRLVATSAKRGADRSSYAAESERMRKGVRPTVILFGTGHGLGPTLVNRCDSILPPLEGPTSYNHLSVRAAAAITFDRLFGLRERAADPI